MKMADSSLVRPPEQLLSDGRIPYDGGYIQGASPATSAASIRALFLRGGADPNALARLSDQEIHQIYAQMGAGRQLFQTPTTEAQRLRQVDSAPVTVDGRPLAVPAGYKQSDRVDGFGQFGKLPQVKLEEAQQAYELAREHLRSLGVRGDVLDRLDTETVMVLFERFGEATIAIRPGEVPKNQNGEAMVSAPPVGDESKQGDSAIYFDQLNY